MVRGEDAMTRRQPCPAASPTPRVQSARAFRAVLEAMARPGTHPPGRRAPRPPAPLSVAAGVALLTLADPTTPLHLAGAARLPRRCATGSPFTSARRWSRPKRPTFALGTWAALQPVNRFRIGQPDYPDRSATLIVEMDRLANHGPAPDRPGHRDWRPGSPCPKPPPSAPTGRCSRWASTTFFTAGDRIAGLPRSTRVEAI